MGWSEEQQQQQGEQALAYTAYGLQTLFFSLPLSAVWLVCIFKLELFEILGVSDCMLGMYDEKMF